MDVDDTPFAGPSLWLYGNGHIEVRGTFVNSSSREMKENIQALDGAEALDVLQSLSPVKFNLKMDAGKSPQAGFIAEDVPELVGTESHRAIRPVNILAILTRIVQSQQASIERLERRLESIQGGTPS